MEATVLADAIGRRSRTLGSADDLDPLIERIGDARLVLLGEASHGTSEYYRWRHRLTERLLTEKDFRFIAVEGDWPDCYRVNRYIKALPEAGADADEVLRGFERWPSWMWANEEVVELVEMLREHNAVRSPERRVGFWGLDLYSLWESMDAVVAYLDQVDPEAAAYARAAYGCFDPYERDVREYAMAVGAVPESCEDEVVAVLRRLRERAPAYGRDHRDDLLDAEQNAVVAKNAEHYYRTMVRGGPESWNVRDTHMIETLDRLFEHHGEDAKAIVWEHNTHVGDARATDMAAAGMVNVGQLARERYGDDDVVIVGFGSYHGRVIAGRAWGAPMQEMPVPPARPDSWEAVLHAAGAADRLLLSRDLDRASGVRERRGQRAIGVVYDPARERRGNYVPTVLPERYDALLYLDRTAALRPLDSPGRADGEPPETYPSGV